MKSIKTKVMLFMSLLVVCVLIVEGIMSLFVSKKEFEKQAKETISLQANQLAQSLTEMEYNTKLLKEQMMAGYDNSIKNQMDIVISILNYYYNQSKNGVITEQEAKNQAMALMRELKYGKSGYFWMDSAHYQLLLLPPAPEKEGMNRENLADQTGKKFIKEMVDGAIQGDNSFVNYHFPKPGDQSTAYPKRGHTRLFKPWQWVPGTGNYIDDIENDIKKYEERIDANFQRKINELSQNGSVAVLDASGKVIYHTKKELAGKRIELKDVNTKVDVIKKITATKDDFVEYTVIDPVTENVQEEISYVKFDPEKNRFIIISRDKDIVFAGITKITNLIIGIILAAALVTLFVMYLLARSFTKPILALKEISEKVSRGDLTVEKVEVKSKDEIGQLSVSINMMVDNIKNLIGKVAVNADQVAAASQQISASTEEIAGSSNNQSLASQNMTELFKELSIVINSVAQSAEAAADLSDKTVLIAQEGGKVISLSVDGMKQASEQMSKLEDDSNQIGKIIEVIDEISEQTNLLALNAAIEAARAGEQGRGFAVVADEVRKLAERSGEATKQITAIIKGMQGNTQLSVNAVSDGVLRSLQTGEAFEKIIAMVNETALKVTEIAAASEEQAAQSSEVMHSIETISTASGESAAAAQETAATSQSLARLAEELNHSVSVFKI